MKPDRSDVRMAQLLLDLGDISRVIQGVRGRRRAQGMDAESRIYARRLRLHRTTASNPFRLSNPASCNFLAMSHCREPILSRLAEFIRLGINSKLAIPLSSSGTTARGIMWSTLNWSPLYGPFVTVAALPRLTSARPLSFWQPSLSAITRFYASRSMVSMAGLIGLSPPYYASACSPERKQHLVNIAKTCRPARIWISRL